MLDIRPIVYDETNTILGGNMRYKALEVLELEGFEVKDNWFKCVKDLTEKEKKEFIIKDNVPFGDWDWDTLLMNGDLPLNDWGLDISKWTDEEEETRLDKTEKKKVVCLNVGMNLVIKNCNFFRLNILY